MSTFKHWYISSDLNWFNYMQPIAQIILQQENEM